MIELYDCQKDAYAEIVRWLGDGKEPGLILEGPAGSGKTHIIKYLMQEYPQLIGITALTAPINQAVKVLRKLQTGCACMTIYSLLGLKMEQYEDTLRLVKTEGSKDGKFSLIVGDEGSMVPLPLIPYVSESMKRGRRYLFLADRKQINPIGERRSQIFKMFRRVTLTEVVRHDNAILQAAMHIREAKSPRHVNLKSNNDGCEGVWCFDSPAKFERRIEKYAELELFFGEHTKVIAWRNDTVARYNNLIRNTVFGTLAESYVNRDQLVFIQPFEDKNQDLKLFIDDIVCVKSSVVGEHIMYKDIKCYYLTVVCDDGREARIPVVCEESQNTFWATLNKFAEKGKGESNSDKRRMAWAAFWTLKESVAHVRYGFALTAHRVQGSTVRNDFLDLRDIFCNSTKSEAMRCAYTGASRPTTKLFIG